MLVDSHCHLDFPDFGDDLDGVLARAADAGVGTVQTICTRVTQFDAVRALAEDHERIWCSVGIHPHHVAEEPEVSADHLVRMAEHPKVIGIGETGLDFHYDNSPRPQQEASFRQHITAARQTGLPLIVHTRSADEDTCRILREEAGKGAFPGVIHCFSAGPAVAETALDIGLHVSFSGILTFKKAEEVRAVARDVPAERPAGGDRCAPISRRCPIAAGATSPHTWCTPQPGSPRSRGWTRPSWPERRRRISSGSSPRQRLKTLN